MPPLASQDIYAETLAVFDDGDDPREPRTTPEVADALDANRRTVYKRLKRLSEHGELETKEAGSRARVWWRPAPERPDAESEDLEFRSLVAAVEEYAVFMLDSSGHVVTWNDGARRIKGYERDEIVGEHISTFYTDDAVAAGAPERNLAQADREGSIEDEGWRVNEDGSRFWANVTITAVRDEAGDLRGYTKITRDMTDMREYERRLERQRDALRDELDEVYARIDDAVYGLDEEWRFTWVNERAERLLDRPESELLGTVLWEEYPDAAGSDRYRHYREAMETQESVQFTEYLPSHDRWYEIRVYPSETGLSIHSLDVTERKVRERELEASRRRLATLVEHFPNGAVTLVDDDLRYVAVGGTPVGEFGLTNDELRGELLAESLPQELADIVVPHYEAALRGEFRTFEEEVGGDTYEFRFVPVHDDGEVSAALGMSQDITDHRAYERTLEERIRQQKVVTDLGQRALEGHDVDALLTEAVEMVAETLDTDYCKVLDLDADAETLLLRQGVGWDDGIVGSKTVSAAENGSQAAHTLASGRPVVVEDLTTETRFSGPTLLTSHGVRSGISTVIGSFDDPWGILGTHDTDRREFSEQDVNFVQTVANVLATAIRRREYERKLGRQRGQLAALDNLNAVVREITGAVIEQSTRGEIEQTVCDQLTASGSYASAWIADLDRRMEAVIPRTSAGPETLADPIELETNPKNSTDSGPVEAAFRTGEIAVSRDVDADYPSDSRRHGPEGDGYRTFAAIPIQYEATLYGMIGVYSKRAEAFDGNERAVVGQLGEIVGHAIAGVEQKRALLSDRVTEIRLHLRDVFGNFDLPVPADGAVSVDHVVPVEEGKFLVYGTATGSAMDVVNAMAEGDSHSSVESLTVLGTDDDSRFQLELTDAPLLSAITTHGGYVHEATLEDGECVVAIHLTSSADVKPVIERFKGAFPGAEMAMRRQTTRSDRTPEQVAQLLSSRMTDRQQAALEASYFAGYFSWPRESSGEDVAASLGISSSTFHQHVRKAEKQLLDVIFDTT